MGKKEFSADFILSSDPTLLTLGSVYEQLTVGVAAVEFKAGAIALSPRSSVVLQAHPDNTGYIYLGLDNLVTAAHNFFCLAGGSAVSIRVDNAAAVKVWAIGSAAGQKVGVLEGKG